MRSLLLLLAVLTVLASPTAAATTGASVESVSQLFVNATDPLVEVRGGRFMFQPSLAADAAGRRIIAFDFSGVTASVLFNGALTVSVLLFQPKTFWTVPNAERNNRFNATLYATDSDGNPTEALQWILLSTDRQHPSSVAPIEYKLFDGLNVWVNYRLHLVKVTEPDAGWIYPTPNFVELHGFFFIGTNDSPTVFSAARNFSRRVEFIGDSITCGYCNTCNLYPNLTTYEAESFALSWAHLTCQELHADCHVVAWSGFGMARNCCGGGTILPEIYNRTLGSVNGSAWNFTGSPLNTTVPATQQSYWEPPHAVVINLGTNDYSQGADISANYTRNYIELLQQIVAQYGSTTEIFLACGPMTDVYCGDVFSIIESVSAWARVNFLDQRHILNSGNMCCWHPDTVSDALMANVTVATLQTVMGWY